MTNENELNYITLEHVDRKVIGNKISWYYIKLATSKKLASSKSITLQLHQIVINVKFDTFHITPITTVG